MHRTTVTLAAVLLGGYAHAETFDFFATITSDQAVPATASPATGTLAGTYDDVANTFSFTWDISDNLVGSPSSPGAHLHDGDFGQTGPVDFAFNNPDGTWALSGSAVWSGLTSSQVDDLFAGGYYANFHTTSFPAGEIRGQLELVPAPGTFAAFGLAGLSMSRRRRR